MSCSTHSSSAQPPQPARRTQRFGQLDEQRLLPSHPVSALANRKLRRPSISNDPHEEGFQGSSASCVRKVPSFRVDSQNSVYPIQKFDFAKILDHFPNGYSGGPNIRRLKLGVIWRRAKSRSRTLLSISWRISQLRTAWSIHAGMPSCHVSSIGVPPRLALSGCQDPGAMSSLAASSVPTRSSRMSTQASHVRHCPARCRELRLWLLPNHEGASAVEHHQPILAHKLLDRPPDRIAANAVLVGQLQLAR